MVIICPTLCISGCAQGSSELSYRQVAARDYRVPEGIDRHSVIYSTVLYNTMQNGWSFFLDFCYLSYCTVD